jgi:WD40 repeat protein
VRDIPLISGTNVLRGSTCLATPCDAVTGEELLAFAGVGGVDPDTWWSPSGDRILTGGLGGAAKVWDANTGNELLSLEIGVSLDASWSPDGTLFAISDSKGNLKVFPA